MLFNKKLTATLLAALILTSATNADAMGWSWKKWTLFGAVATVAALVIKKMWATPQVVPAVNNQANALSQELIRAAFHGNLAQVRALIAAGADVNAQDPDGDTALIFAATYGHTEIVQALIAAGADVNAQNQYGNTALMSAANSGHTEIMQVLIDAGADVNAQTNYYGNTALMLAIREGHTDAAQLLIAAGAHVDTQSYSGNTALTHATQCGYTETVRALIGAGVNVNPQDQAVRATLSFASRHTNRNIFNLLTQEQNRVSTHLHQACSHGIGSENIELFLRNEVQRRAIEHLFADINNLPAGTLTPRIEELLHGENANVDVVNTNGYTARQYLQTRAWMMQTITITIRFLNGDKLTLNCTRGTQIHALKRLIAQHISTPEHTVNTSMMTLTRKNNNAEATDYEVAGITTAFHMVIGDTQQHNPGRAQAGPANA